MIRARILLHLALSLAGALLLASSAHGQYRGSIRGTVTDASGAVVPGATVTLLNKDTNLAMTTSSDQAGIYSFNAIPAASYKITVEHAGYKTKVVESVRIIPDQPNALDLQLEVGEVKETVTVRGTTETANTETATVSGTLRSNEIATLPASGRNIFMLVQLAPGITGDNSQGANGSGSQLPGTQGPGNPGLAPGVNSGIFAVENGPQAVTGGMGYQHNGVSLDGISTASAVWGGTTVITPSPEAVGEVKIISNSYDAENGRFAGAQIQVTSKSGGNQPHGSAFFTAHRPGLNAYQSWNGNGPVTRDDQFFSQFGGSLGGPIWKNKVFGFFSWETSRTPAAQVTHSTAWMETAALQGKAPSGSIAATYLSFPGSLPSGTTINDVSCANAGFAANCTMITGQGLDIGSPLTSGLGTQDMTWVSSSNPGVGNGLDGSADIAQYNITNFQNSSSNQYIGRLDAYLTQKDRLAGSIYWVPQSQTSSGTRSYDLFHHNQISNAFSLIWNRSISATMVNEVRFNAAGWRWDELKDNPQSPLGLPADYVGQMGSVSLERFGPQVGSHLNQWTYTFKDVASKVLGAHNVKFGAEITRLFYLQACMGCALPSYNFYNIWDFVNDAPNSESAMADPATGTPSSGRQDMRENLWGFFAQDDYKLRKNLTLNVGLRWSYFGPLHSKQDNMYRGVPGAGTNFLTGLNVVKTNSWSSQKNNFSPQIGVAWSPTRFKNKMVVRGGFGINYNQEEIAISANISGNPGLTVWQGLSSGGPGSINPNILYATANPLNSMNYPANPAFQMALGANGLPVSGSAGLFIFPQDLPTMRAEHYSADVQYEFWKKWTASLGYQGTNSHNIIANAQIFPYAASMGYALNGAIQGNSWSNYWNASGYGNYSAIIADVKTNSWHDLLFDLQYTWSRSKDTNTGPYTYDVYPYQASLNYAPSDNNVPRAWKIYASYTPKFFNGKPAWMERTLGGWTLSGIFNIHTGFPWTAVYYLPGGASLYCGSCWYGSVYPVAMSGAGTSTSNSAYETGSNFGGQTGNHLSYFTLPTYTAYTGDPLLNNGNANPQAGMLRNSITGPGYRSVDLSLNKAFALGKVRLLGEGAKLQFRVDAYNLFNNLNLTSGNNGIDRNILDPNFGRSWGALAARVVTMGARFEF